MCAYTCVCTHIHIALTQFCVRSKTTTLSFNQSIGTELEWNRHILTVRIVLYSKVKSISTEGAVSHWLKMWDLDENTSVGILALLIDM